MNIQIERLILEDMVEILNKHELVAIAKNVKPQIPGFSPPNFGRAPLLILKKETKAKLFRLKNPSLFLKKWVEDQIDKYRDQTPKDFVINIQLDRKLTPAQQLVLYGLLFPEEYEKHREQILNNIAEKRFLFKDIMEEAPSALDHLQVLTKSGLDQEIEWLDKLISNTTLQEEKNGDDPQSIGLKEYWQTHGFPSLYAGDYLTLYHMYRKEIMSWNSAEQHAILKLAFLDLLHQHVSAHNELQTINSETEALKERTRQLEERLEEKNKLLKEKELKQNELEKALANQKKELEEKHTAYQKLSLKYHEAQQQLESLQTQLEKAQADLEKFNPVHHMQPSSYLLDQPDIKLLTTVNDPDFHLYINPDSVVEFNSAQELLQFIEKHVQQLTGQYVFINSDGLTSKEQFEIELNLKLYPISWKFVSGGIRGIVNSMIYYMEGDMKYEA